MSIMVPPIHVETDTSDYVIAGIISQISPDDGNIHLIAFYSCSMQPTELNHNIYNKELLSIFKAFWQWRCMYAFVCRVQEGLFVWGRQRFHFCSSFLRSWCLFFSVFPFLKKEWTQMGNPCTQTQIKRLSTSPDDMPEEVPEDIWLMRGLCGSERWSRSLTHFERVYSRVTMILSSKEGLCKRP